MSLKRALNNGSSQFPDLYNGDKICTVKNNVLKFGSVAKYGEIELINHTKSSQKTPQLKVLWQGEKKMKHVKGSCQVYDRLFFVGQEVQCGARIGRVIASHELATVTLCNNDIMGSPIHLDDLSPVTKLFTGVHVELNGWIGIIIRVDREIQVELEKPFKNSICRITKSEPCSFTCYRIKRRRKGKKRVRLNRRYPFKNFIQSLKTAHTTYFPFKGKYIEFGFEELKNGRWEDKNLLHNFRGRRPKKVVGKVLTSKCKSAQIQWLQRIPCVPSKMIPPERLQETDNEFHHMKYFHIDPVRFMEYTAILNMEIHPESITMGQEEFSEHFTNLLRGNTERQKKRQKLQEISESGQVQVTKWFSSHMYEVKMHETDQVEVICGRELLPLQIRSKYRVQKTQFPGITYVSKTESVAGDGEYGVVLGMKLEENLEITCEVQWLKLNGNEIEEVETVNVSRKNIAIHSKYNNFRAGAIVHKSEYPNKVGFEYGTIVQLERYNYGKIQVYCPKFEVRKQLWPHQLETLKLDAPKILKVSRN